MARLLTESSSFLPTHAADLGHNHLATLAVSMRYTQSVVPRCELERACKE